MKNSIESFKKAKKENKKLTMLTAYDYSTATLMDTTGINGILVGDSLGMVCLGYKNTLSVTMEDMLHHTKAVTRAVKNAIVVGDMPFLSYQTSVYDAVKNAGRFIKEANADSVKLEGGAIICPQIEAIINAQIPVMGHIGLTPQSINIFGGFKVQGKSLESAKQLIEDAKRLEAAGVFAIVLEGIPAALAKIITECISIPTIGIGAGADCDGQILVYQDMLGLYSDFTPKFAKQFANIGKFMQQGINEYIKEVMDGTFPAKEHCFSTDQEIIEKLSRE